MLFASVLFGSLVGYEFSRKPAAPIVEGYRVVSYDSRTGEWTVLRNGTFDGIYLVKRMTLLCSFYKWGDHEKVSGSRSCDLHVGSMLVENWFPSRTGKPFLDVFEMSPDRLAITEGSDPDSVEQQFIVLKQELVQ